MNSTPADAVSLPFPKADRDKRCAGQHFGAWAVEPKWFQAALASVRNGTLPPRADWGDDEDDESPTAKGYTLVGPAKDIALITIDGQMTKRGSSFGGCSTVAVRRALRDAAADYAVRSIILHICSPGGTVAGTADLAEDVAAVRAGKFGKAKSVTAYVADMGCSAAYWVASQCDRIYANTTAVVGSIGTYTVLEDDTKLQEEIGIKWRVVSTGKYKGLGADGAVTEELVADVQREVNELNKPFLAAVSAGRGNKIPDIAAVSDGRAYVSEQAKALGLVDEIASLDAAVEAVSKNTRSNTMTPTEQVKAIAAEHPESVASFREEGRKAGHADGRKEYADGLRGNVEAAGNDYELAVKATLAGHDAEAVKLAVAARDKAAADTKAQAEAHAAALAEKDKEIERLKFEQSGRGPINTAGATADAGKGQSGANATAAEDFAKIEDPKERAKAEWAADFGGCKAAFTSEAAYVGFRSVDLRGGVTIHKPAAA